MLFTRIGHPAFLDDTAAFRATDKAHIFQQVEDDYYVVALEYVLEEGEGQYPMEDVLDRFLCHIERFEVEVPVGAGGQVDLFANSQVERLSDAVEQLVGRRAYNVEEDDGIALVIDDSVPEGR